MTATIETEDLAKQYRMGDLTVDALDGVDISIEEQEYVSIMGPSGSGKSTLMHLIGLLDSPTRGTVRISGRDTGRLSKTQQARFRLEKIGFVFQFYSLLAGFTALENVYLPLLMTGTGTAEATDAAADMLERVGLGDRLHHRPSELSGGQRQRVAIARAIANDPDIVLADEPNSQLDTATSEQIMALFDSLRDDGTTIVVVNHERQFGELADRIIWLEDGTLREDR